MWHRISLMLWISEVSVRTYYIDLIVSPMFHTSASLKKTETRRIIFLQNSHFLFTRILQGLHKRMVRFQKLTRNLFLTLHGHNVHRQQRQLSILYATSISLLILTAGPRGQFPRWPHGPAVSMRSELLVAHEKLGQLPLLTVYVVPV